MKNNKAIYSTVEFDSWAFREGLIDTERFLIEQYLDKEGKTLEAGTGGGRILLEMKKWVLNHYVDLILLRNS